MDCGVLRTTRLNLVWLRRVNERLVASRSYLIYYVLLNLARTLLCFEVYMIPSPYSEGTKRVVISILVWVPGPLDCQTVGPTTITHARGDVTDLWNWTFCEYNFLVGFFLINNYCYSYKWSGREMNSLTNTRRQLRFQKRREQSRARLACQTKEEHERRLQLRREVHKRREQSRWAKKRSQEEQKRLKAKRQRDSSRLQCQQPNKRLNSTRR